MSSARASTEPVRGPRRRTPRVGGEARERAILNGLGRLLAERPWRDLAVDDLARAGGISRPTFYFYFASKEDALLALLHGLVAEAQAAIADAPELLAHDRHAAWQQAIAATYRTWIGNRHVIRAAADARSTHPGIAQLWTDLLEDYVQQTTAAIEVERARGAAPPGIPARDLAICLNRMNERIYESALGGEAPAIPEDRVLDSLVAVWLAAIYGDWAPRPIGPTLGR